MFRKTKYPKYVLSETVDPGFDGWINITTGKFNIQGERSQRLIIGLNQIKSKYIIYLQEDFWLYGDVDQNMVENLISICEDHEIQLLKLHEGNVNYILEKSNISIGGYNLSRVNKNSDYLMCHAISIRNKEFLIKQVSQKKLEDPRTNEIMGTFRMKFDKKTPTLFHFPLFSTKNILDNNCPSRYREVCRKGKYNIYATDFIKYINTQGKQ